MLITSCKSENKKSDIENIDSNTEEVENEADFAEMEEEFDFADLLETAIMALEGNDKKLAVLNLNKASDYFKPEAMENDDDKESNTIAEAIHVLALDVQNDKIKTSDALLAAIKQIDGLKEMFTTDEADDQEVDTDSDQ
jgi:hypothetical protein